VSTEQSKQLIGIIVFTIAHLMICIWLVTVSPAMFCYLWGLSFSNVHIEYSSYISQALLSRALAGREQVPGYIQTDIHAIVQFTVYYIKYIYVHVEI
jgi:hypothetical protein